MPFRNHLGSDPFSAEYASFLNSKDLSFLRALLDEDYSHRKPDIFRQQIAAIQADLKQTDSVSSVLFDYHGTRAIPSIVPSISIGNELPSPFLRSHYRRRILQSAGRFELHLIALHVAGRLYNVVLPMHSSDSRIHDDLLVLANQAANGDLAGEELDAEIVRLTRLDVRIIH